MDQDTKNLISSKVCGRCGGASDGWKCPQCGRTMASYDPSHWRQCPGSGKLQVKCKACGEAESHCKCR